jgi:ATP-dependent DNA helicase RecG
MLTQAELVALLSDLESDRVERTVSLTNMDKYCEAVTAFANDLPNHRQPGYLLIGVHDNGSLANLTIDDKFLQTLGGIRSDGNIQPLPSIQVGHFRLEGGDVAVVEVRPSDLPPVRYKGRVHIRVGPRKAIATEQEERILSERRISYAPTFDARPCAGATLEDLILDLFKFTYLPNAVSSEVLKANHREVRAQLASLRFYDTQSNCPTNAGVLLFGKDPLSWLPLAFVQYVKFSTESITSEVLAERRVSGDLLSVLRELDLLLEQLILHRPIRVSTLRERQVYNYPPNAIRELMMNAVLHRDYSANSPIRLYEFASHIEIQSPGGLYGSVSPENFPTENSYRNPVIAEAVKTLGYVNAFGRGVAVAREAMSQNGNPQIEFSFDTHYVLATLRSAL